MRRLYVSGYRSYELGIFDKKDKRLFYLKEFLKEEFRRYADSGLEWVITSGNLGIELWAGLALIDLNEELSQLNLALLLPYKGFGNNWNDDNRKLLTKVVEGADYVNLTSQDEYKHGGQLKGNAQFILNNSDGLLLVYDPDKKGKPAFLYDQARAYSQAMGYPVHTINFEELQEFVIDYQEIHNVK